MRRTNSYPEAMKGFLGVPSAVKCLPVSLYLCLERKRAASNLRGDKLHEAAEPIHHRIMVQAFVPKQVLLTSPNFCTTASE
jgi:hypothetical protein